MPSALNNFVLVLSHHHKRKLLREVPYGRGTEIISHFMNPSSVFWGRVFFVCLFSEAYMCISPYEAYLTPLSHTHTHTEHNTRPHILVFRHYWTQYNFKIQVFTVFTLCD